MKRKISKNYEAPSTYRDADGQEKTFTYINHDSGKLYPLSSVDTAGFDPVQHRKELQDEILSESGSLCPLAVQSKYVKGEEGSLAWRENVIRDEGLPLDYLVNLVILVRNRKKLYT